ncbi:MAG: hypothetical protein JW940_09700 [Polyangiaceae bacterium]|nr:hypothetical protein [Polyangiaceae bacterium]
MHNESARASLVRGCGATVRGSAACVLFALLLVGCGGQGSTDSAGGYAGSGSDSPRDGAGRICDGTGIRFAWQSMGMGFPTVGQKLACQNGGAYLFVDAECHYWTQGGRPEGMPDDVEIYVARTGQLTAEQEEQLSSDMGYADWTARAEVDSYADGTAEYLWRPGLTMTLSGNLFAKPLGQTQLKTWIDTAASWSGKLYDAGTDMDGPLRVRAVTAPAEMTNPGAPESPLLDVAEMAITWDNDALLDMSDPATLVTDPDVVELLREQRVPIANGEYADPNNPDRIVLPVQEDGQLYFVYFRDVIPLEDDNGLIRPY